MASKPVEIPKDGVRIPSMERDFLRVAVEILGRGYSDDYYDTLICEFRWAYEQGWHDAVKAAGKTARKKGKS